MVGWEWSSSWSVVVVVALVDVVPAPVDEVVDPAMAVLAVTDRVVVVCGCVVVEVVPTE